LFGLYFSSIGLQALEFGKIYPKHTEAMRKAVRRGLRRVIKSRGKQRNIRTKPYLTFQLFPYSSLTRKGMSRMGGGKGAHDE
jgi:ribosomal protein L16/L10AE